MAEAPDRTRETGQPEPAGDAGTTRKVRWEDSNLQNTYANVCNVLSTREEFLLLFGINQAWERGQDEITIQLTDRIILSPFAAKRLSQLLAEVVKQYEARFGALEDRGPGAG
jgi:hypothetical protein